MGKHSDETEQIQQTTSTMLSPQEENCVYKTYVDAGGKQWKVKVRYGNEKLSDIVQRILPRLL